MQTGVPQEKDKDVFGTLFHAAQSFIVLFLIIYHVTLAVKRNAN